MGSVTPPPPPPNRGYGGTYPHLRERGNPCDLGSEANMTWGRTPPPRNHTLAPPLNSFRPSCDDTVRFQSP